MEYRPEEKHKYIDLNYEEISSDRNIADGNFSNGLQNFRFSVAPGNSIIPYMSYMLIEYNFGANDGKGNPYLTSQPLVQSQKIALQNNWVSCLYNSCRYTVAQSEIGVVNSNHAQLHTLKQRLGHTTSFIEHLGNDLNSFDPDFSRRLARSCSDGLYHRDGLIDCSPYNSNALTPLDTGAQALYTQAEDPLPLVSLVPYTGLYYSGSNFSTPTANAAVSYGYMSKNIVFDIAGGGAIPTGDAGLANAIVSSIQWQLPDFSNLPGTPVENAGVIDGTLIQKEDVLQFFVGTFGSVLTAQQIAFNLLSFRVGDIKAAGSRIALNLIPVDPATLLDIKLIPNNLIAIFGVAPSQAISGIVSVSRKAYANPYTQADPRSGVVNGMVAYQPPLSFFEIRDPAVFFGDVEIQMTPNSNWQQACIESAVPHTFYNTDVKHGTDYCFGVKSVRLYLARCRLLSPPPERAMLMLPDYQVSNKQLPNGSSTINFNIPPSTNKIVVWIQDSAVGSNTKLPLTRFKTRQYINSTSNLSNMNKYGPWAKTYDEKLRQIQLNFAGITKPVTNFQRGGSGAISDPSTVSMLQRWITGNQHNANRLQPEKFNDWLSMGAYYYFNFERSADNNGTYLTINVTYDGDVPTDGTSNSSGVSSTPSTVNIFVCSIYDREVALTYNQYGNVVSAQTQMR